MARLIIAKAPPEFAAALGASYPLGDGETSVGTGLDNTISLQGPGIARSHVVFRRRPDGGFQVEDLGSHTGTFVNGYQIPAGKRPKLSIGNKVRVGPFELLFAADAAPAAPTARKPAAPPPEPMDLPDDEHALPPPPPRAKPPAARPAPPPQPTKPKPAEAAPKPRPLPPEPDWSPPAAPPTPPAAPAPPVKPKTAVKPKADAPPPPAPKPPSAPKPKPAAAPAPTQAPKPKPSAPAPVKAKAPPAPQPPPPPKAPPVAKKPAPPPPPPLRMPDRLLRLSEWWAKGREAPPKLTSSLLTGAAKLSGTTYLRVHPDHPARAAEWYQAYLTDPSVNQALLPVALPYLIDLTAVVACRQPPLRRAGHPDYVAAYQEGHLCPLAYNHGVGFVRRQAVAARTPAARRALVAQFVARVFGWVVNAWLDATCGPDDEARREELARCSGPLRLLSEPDDVQAFLVQLAGVVKKKTHARGGAAVFDRLELFLLGASAHIPEAFMNMDQVLIHECLASVRLEEDEYDPRPLHRLPLTPEVPSRQPGEDGEVRGVRRTTRVEELPSVIPQELAAAGLGEDGTRVVIDQLINSGLMKWERRDMEREVTRTSVLVCFVADVGPAAQVAAGTASAANTPSVHARRLIFECVRDIAAAVEPPAGGLDVHVFLDPGRDWPDRRRAWKVTLDDLRRTIGKSVYDDMMAVEGFAPGYFFPAHRAAAPGADHHAFIEDVFGRCSYDQTLFVFLGPESTLPDLLPAQPPPARKQTGARDRVFAVQLGPWPDASDVVRGRWFDDPWAGAEPEYTPDAEFRHAVLEELIGDRRARQADDFDLEPERGVPA